ncbi:MAG: transcription antitermination factor NusB [Eubacteriales bacterium]
MSRREARESAFKLLYQMEIRKSDPVSQRDIFLEEYPLADEDVGFFDELVTGVTVHAEELDALFVPLLKGWKTERLPKVDLVILRIATFEIRMRKDVPLNVSISEAVILAKRYSSEESKAYINAILGKLTPGEKE